MKKASAPPQKTSEAFFQEALKNAFGSQEAAQFIWNCFYVAERKNQRCVTDPVFDRLSAHIGEMSSDHVNIVWIHLLQIASAYDINSQGFEINEVNITAAIQQDLIPI